MNYFFSKFVDKVKAPTSETISERIMSTWTTLLGCTLQNSPQNLADFHEKLLLLIQAIHDGVDGGQITTIMQVLSENQIPMNLVNLAFADIPHGLVNEVTLFFTEIAKGHTSQLLTQQFVIKPLNTFLESAQPSDANRFNALIETLISHITNIPDDIQLFIMNETSAPLIHQFTQMVVSHYQVMGDALLQIMNSSRTIPNLLVFLTTYSPLIATLIEFIRDCLDSKSIDSQKQRFLLSINMSLNIAPNDFSTSFMKYFTENILRSFVIEKSNDNNTIPQALQNIIYLLCTFTTPVIATKLIDFLTEKLPTYLSTGDEAIQFLSLRAMSLILEHAEPVLDDAHLAPEEFKVSLDFMGFLNSDWFVWSDINKQLQEARTRVSLALSRTQTIFQETQIKFKIMTILPALFSLLKSFSTNSFKVNLALTDVFTTLSSVWNPNITYFFLSAECTDGLYVNLRDLCQHYNGRLGAKPGVPQLISTAYENIDKDEEITTEEDKYYRSLVLCLEFIKELHATAQAKNMLNQTESIVPQ